MIGYGTAEVHNADDADRALEKEMPRHYLGFIGAMGYQQTARDAVEAAGGDVVLVVKPERYASFDFAAETPWYGQAWLMLKRVLPAWL